MNCAFPDCDGIAKTKLWGLCSAHDWQRRQGQALRPKKLIKPHGTWVGRGCRAPLCSKPVAGDWLCNTHARMKIPFEWFVFKFAFQDGKCAVCRTPFTSKKIYQVDHDHRCCSGRRGCLKCARGLVCHYCNTMLGGARDEPWRLMAGEAYLERVLDFI